MQRGLVGSEMCIRDRVSTQSTWEKQMGKEIEGARRGIMICGPKRHIRSIRKLKDEIDRKWATSQDYVTPQELYEDGQVLVIIRGLHSETKLLIKGLSMQSNTYSNLLQTLKSNGAVAGRDFGRFYIRKKTYWEYADILKDTFSSGAKIMFKPSSTFCMRSESSVPDEVSIKKKVFSSVHQGVQKLSLIHI
eukprot:TRINITY_DN22398_c0_g1_i2.p2 TRINITY_DN22398_c0_g1~~TRINITY_DN22398_c0_g1_i2.p2  ORF type:complete len:191 (-),score=21.78 TRINITY_DN22398_c0_g1_i2:169-741(-)